MGTGFIKCIPITLSFLLVTLPISLIEIDDVLLARIVLGSHNSSSFLKISNLIFFDSVAASIIKSLFFTVWFNSVLNAIRLIMISFSDYNIIFF